MPEIWSIFRENILSGVASQLQNKKRKKKCPKKVPKAKNSHLPPLIPVEPPIFEKRATVPPRNFFYITKQK
jgi:hypothetical protein